MLQIIINIFMFKNMKMENILINYMIYQEN